MSTAEYPPPKAGGESAAPLLDGRKQVSIDDGGEPVSNERIRALSDAGRLQEHLHLDADKFLIALGRMPPYQMFIVCLIGSIWVFYAFQVMAVALVGEYHPYTCVSVNNETTVGANDTAPIYDMSCSALGPDGREHKCDLSDDNYTLAYDPSFGQTMVSEFDLVCHRRYMAHLASTFYQLGTGVASLLLAQASDIVGRKPIFLACYWAAIGMAIVMALMPTYVLVVAARFLLGCSTTGMTGTGWVLVSESVAPHQRAFFLSVSLNLIWVAGYMLLGVAAMNIPNWRTMGVTLAVPFLSMVALYWLVQESLHWLIAEKYYGRAVAMADRLQTLNCASVELAECKKDYIGEVHRPRRTVIDILKSPVLMIFGLVVCYNGIVAMMVYYGLSLFSTRLSSDRFTGYFLSGLIEIPAGITAPVLLMWFGRKKVLLGSLLMCLIGLTCSAFLPRDSPEWMRLVCYLIAKYGNICFFPPNFLLQTEIFPTTVRNVAFGFLGTISTVGSMAAPFVGGLTDIDPRLPNAIWAVMCVIAMAGSLLLPETMNTQLPEDIDEVQPGPVLRRWFKPQRKLTLFDADAMHEIQQHSRKRTL